MNIAIKALLFFTLASTNLVYSAAEDTPSSSDAFSIMMKASKSQGKTKVDHSRKRSVRAVTLVNTLVLETSSITESTTTVPALITASSDKTPKRQCLASHTTGDWKLFRTRWVNLDWKISQKGNTYINAATGLLDKRIHLVVITRFNKDGYDTDDKNPEDDKYSAIIDEKIFLNLHGEKWFESEEKVKKVVFDMIEQDAHSDNFFFNQHGYHDPMLLFK